MPEKFIFHLECDTIFLLTEKMMKNDIRFSTELSKYKTPKNAYLYSVDVYIENESDREKTLTICHEFLQNNNYRFYYLENENYYRYFPFTTKNNFLQTTFLYKILSRSDKFLENASEFFERTFLEEFFVEEKDDNHQGSYELITRNPNTIHEYMKDSGQFAIQMTKDEFGYYYSTELKNARTMIKSDILEPPIDEFFHLPQKNGLSTKKIKEAYLKLGKDCIVHVCDKTPLVEIYSLKKEYEKTETISNIPILPDEIFDLETIKNPNDIEREAINAINRYKVKKSRKRTK